MTGATADRRPLDDIMLAMDVVDTLRHQQLLVERELNAEDRDEKMKQRLREIYASQGIEVPDDVLEQGVSALRQGRFVYDPPPAGVQTGLARLYVSRGTWGRPVLLVAGIVFAIWLAYAVLISGPAERAAAALPARLDSQYQQLVKLAKGPQASEQTESLMAEGRAALRNKDEDAVELALERMATLERDIDREYELRIANRPGERSGVWRIPDANPGARNYYIVVEAVDRHGGLVDVPVVNEEDGKTYRVSEWGMRVDESLFRRVADDKTDDGIIQNNRFGVKRRGYLTPEYLMPTTGDAITRW
jgi:hypothetical protein